MHFTSTLMIAVLVGSASATEPTLEKFEFEEPHMGTLFRIVLFAPDKPTAEKASKAAFERIEALNGIMSDYLPASELMELCKKNATMAGEPVRVSPELFTVLAKGQEIAELSEGSFDVTVGPVVKLWRKARKTEKLPDSQELAAAMKKVGYKHLELDPQQRSVRLRVAGMQLDLGGIAKGYAADEGLGVLAKFGISRAMVAASGDIAVAEPPPGKSHWRIEIGKLTKKSPRRVLLLKNQAVSTSGDAEQFVEINGVRYSHLLDPHTGIGLTGRRSVSVVSRRGILSDSLTKPASILPMEKVLALLKRYDAETSIVQIKDQGEETTESPGFAALLAKE